MRGKLSEWARSRPYLTAVLLFEVLYTLFCLLAFMFVDPTPDVDCRTMLPILPAAILVLVMLAGEVLRERPGPRWPKALLAATKVIICFGYGLMTLDILQGLDRTRMGLRSRMWRDLDLVRQVAGLSPQWSSKSIRSLKSCFRAARSW